MKADNVLITNEGMVKVGDFGIAMKLHSKETEKKLPKVVGTLPYMSPEMLKEKKACKACDIWGIGITLFEACVKNETRAQMPNVRDLHPD